MKKTVKTTLITLAALTAILTTSACGAHTAQIAQITMPADLSFIAENDYAAEETTENSRLEELKENLNTIRDLDQATDIVNGWYRQALTAVSNNDLAGFEQLYDSGFDASVIAEDLNFFKERFFGNEVYSVDVTATAFDEDEIAFDVLYYYNYINENGDSSNRSNTICNRALRLEDGIWKFSSTGSDEIIEKIKQSRKEIYGEYAYNNGFCSLNYQMMTGKALLSDVNVDVKNAVVNSDGSVTLELGIENGYNVDKVLTKLNGTIDFGKDDNSLFTVVDLSRPYICAHNLANLHIPAKSVTFVTVTVAPQDLVNPVSDNLQIAGRCSISFHTSQQNA